MIYDIEQICNTIAETFFYNEHYNGCIITLRLHNNPYEIDSFYQIVYAGRSTYKLILGKLTYYPCNIDGKYNYLCYHDSAWRQDSYIKLEEIYKNYRKVTIDDITPMRWDIFPISIHPDNNFQVTTYEYKIESLEE